LSRLGDIVITCSSNVGLEVRPGCEEVVVLILACCMREDHVTFASKDVTNRVIHTNVLSVYVSCVEILSLTEILPVIGSPVVFSWLVITVTVMLQLYQGIEFLAGSISSMERFRFRFEVFHLQLWLQSLNGMINSGIFLHIQLVLFCCYVTRINS